MDVEAVWSLCQFAWQDYTIIHVPTPYMVVNSNCSTAYVCGPIHLYLLGLVLSAHNKALLWWN